MPHATANGIDIYYEQRGEGQGESPDLVCIMGLGAHLGAWALNRNAFEASYRTTLFDNRGAGRTTAPDEPYSIRGMADDTAALMDALGIKSANVMGASMGGMIAQELAINYPEKVNRLVIACSRAKTSDLRKLVSVAQRALYEAGVPRDAIAALQQPWGRTTASLQDERVAMEAIALGRKDPHPIATHAYLRQLDATMAHDTLERLHLIRSKTLVLVGAEDILTPPEESAVIAQRIPGARMQILPRGGHGFNGEYAPQFNQAVLEFLAG